MKSSLSRRERAEITGRVAARRCLRDHVRASPSACRSGSSSPAPRSRRPRAMPRPRPGRVRREQIVAEDLEARLRAAAVSAAQPSQSSSARPSSIETIGYCIGERRQAARSSPPASSTPAHLGQVVATRRCKSASRPCRARRRPRRPASARARATASLSSSSAACGSSEPWTETTLGCLQRRQTARGEQLARRASHGRAPFERLPKRLRPHRHDEKVLEGQAALRVQTAADDVHHRQRQLRAATEPTARAEWPLAVAAARAAAVEPAAARWRPVSSCPRVPSSSISRPSSCA